MFHPEDLLTGSSSHETCNDQVASYSAVLGQVYKPNVQAYTQRVDKKITSALQIKKGTLVVDCFIWTEWESVLIGVLP